MSMMKISLAMLTWRSPKTLQHSLASLAPILNFFDEKIMVCQDSDPQEIDLAKRYGFRPVALPQNVGIQNGMKTAFESCANEQVLFLENDLVLRVDDQTARKTLLDISKRITNGDAQFAKLRFLPESRKKKFRRYWKVVNGKPSRRLLGYIKYTTANSMAADTLHFDFSPGLDTKYLKDLGQGIYLSSSPYSKWENFAVFTTKTFFLGTLIPFAETHPTSRNVNGFPDLEHRINSRNNRSWWRKERFKLLIATPGLFSHRRLDRWAEDDKWETADPYDDGGGWEKIR
jgi:glycosyltransferase involved in cell wall biosynthesis